MELFFCLIFVKFCILQKTAFSSVIKSRLALGLPSCLAENGLIHRNMTVDFALVITSIGEPLFQTKPNQGMMGPASLLHSRHWVLFLVNFVLIGFHIKIHQDSKKVFFSCCFFQLQCSCFLHPGGPGDCPGVAPAWSSCSRSRIKQQQKYQKYYSSRAVVAPPWSCKSANSQICLRHTGCLWCLFVPPPASLQPTNDSGTTLSLKMFRRLQG